MQNKKYVSSFIGLAALAVLTMAVPAFAQTTTTPTGGPNNGAYAGQPHAWGGAGHMGGMKSMMKPSVFGTVSAINGSIITITSTHGMRPNTTGSTTTSATPTTTTYTVDATNATITKSNAAGTISSIVVGDTIMAQGTLTGTNLVATTIRDGVMARTPGASNNGQPGQNQTSPITGNGQPVVAGAVTSLSGNTLTITNKSNVTYTVDVTNAKIIQGQTTITISNIAVGDNVVVQGTVNGNSVTASSVIDQKASTSTTATTPQPKGFFGAIGSFFSHIFGF
ncbi:MAG: hypothetical protein P4L63_01350 [Candidatus Pacebacteria bacterium]|nr:hypothetical protein [Candidatus Paceibacterota bacterium]